MLASKSGRGSPLSWRYTQPMRQMENSGSPMSTTESMWRSCVRIMSPPRAAKPNTASQACHQRRGSTTRSASSAAGWYRRAHHCRYRARGRRRNSPSRKNRHRTNARMTIAATGRPRWCDEMRTPADVDREAAHQPENANSDGEYCDDEIEDVRRAGARRHELVTPDPAAVDGNRLAGDVARRVRMRETPRARRIHGARRADASGSRPPNVR